jgi:branched-chain amino acid aminotransferase
MPELPESMFLGAIAELVALDRDWIPKVDGGALYLRPFMFASEAFLGVRPAREYLFLTIASPVGAYFKHGVEAVTIWVSEDYSRAAPGGTGAAKCGGNYAASLAPQAEAIANGCDQVVFLDAAGSGHVEELGCMNLFFLFDDGRLRTPPLNGAILPGVTRDSMLSLARDEGLTVEEAPYAIDDWRRDAHEGRLREVLACGTAAVVTPVGAVKARDYHFPIGNGGAGEMAMRLRKRLTDIQRGLAPDPHGWIVKL